MVNDLSVSFEGDEYMKEFLQGKLATTLFVSMICISTLLIVSDQIEYSRALQGIKVSGTIQLDTTWTNTSDPYIITDNIVVHENATLTVDPDVEIRFQGFYSIKVEGIIEAIGTESEPIILTSDSKVLLYVSSFLLPLTEKIPFSSRSGVLSTFNQRIQ